MAVNKNNDYKEKYRYGYIRIPSESVRHCEIFDCKHGVYPRQICCRDCPVYAECEDHCLNHPDRCGVWTNAQKRKERENVIRSIIGKSDPIGVAEGEGFDV